LDNIDDIRNNGNQKEAGNRSDHKNILTAAAVAAASAAFSLVEKNSSSSGSSLGAK